MSPYSFVIKITTWFYTSFVEVCLNKLAAYIFQCLENLSSLRRDSLFGQIDIHYSSPTQPLLFQNLSKLNSLIVKKQSVLRDSGVLFCTVAGWVNSFKIQF